MFATITPETTPTDLVNVMFLSVTDPTQVALVEAVRAWRLATAPAESINRDDVRLPDGCPLQSIGTHTADAEAFLAWVAAQDAPAAAVAEEERTAQAQALATMRRREADAIADRDRYRAALANAQAAQGPTTLADLKRHPLWQELAREAAEAAVEEGFCSEYDRMANAIGLPNRDDVLGSRTWSREITVTITISQSDETEWGDRPDSYVDRYTLLDSIGNGDYSVETFPSYVDWTED